MSSSTPGDAERCPRRRGLDALPQSSSASRKRLRPHARPQARRRAYRRSRRAGAARVRGCGKLSRPREDGGDLRPALEETGNRESVFTGALDAKRQRLQAAPTRKAGNGSSTEPTRPRGPRRAHEFAAPATTPAMTSWWPFRSRCRLADEVGAVLERATETGRRERIVDDQEPVSFVAASAERSASGNPGLAMVST